MQAVAPLSTERVFALKSVRLFYKKSGLIRFASHLDMNRIMTRLLRMSKVPVWYTEGFNRHPYITFALPLSLGFTSEYEVMDFRFDEDDFDIKNAEKMISAVCPEGIEVITLAEPVYKSGKIAYADFKITFDENSAVNAESLNVFLNRQEIIVSKKTKKGGVKEIDLAKKLASFEVLKQNENIVLLLRLPAGGEDNINPKILVDKYLSEINKDKAPYSVCRTMLRLSGGEEFK